MSAGSRLAPPSAAGNSFASRAARQGLERALAIDETAYGPDHTTVARDVNNLAGVLRDLDDLAGARRGLERALAIVETAYGPNHRQTVTIAENLRSLPSMRRRWWHRG